MTIKYDIDYNNVCVLFYRGNDKIIETKLCKYDEYLKIATHIHKINPNIRFLLQSDETEFIEYFSTKLPNSFYFKEEIRHMKKCNNTVDKIILMFIYIFLVVFLLCKLKFNPHRYEYYNLNICLQQ